ncbi:unnamed protein product [Amoebophrya sp. A25]|nr:unnamed protein product [Amoebophrya sp. A25]|eukprot:GSA25T00002607001.1
MTDFLGWEKKAKQLVEACKDEEEQEKEAADLALGLDGGKTVEGPPVAAAKQQLDDFKTKSEERKNLIDRLSGTEVLLVGVVDNRLVGKGKKGSANGVGNGVGGEAQHERSGEAEEEEDDVLVEDITAGDQGTSGTTATTGESNTSPPPPGTDKKDENKKATQSATSSAKNYLTLASGHIVERLEDKEKAHFSIECPEPKCVRVQKCENSTLRFTTKTIKFLAENCSNCRFEIDADVMSSSCEIWNCTDCTFVFRVPVQSVQADKCTQVTLDWEQQALMQFVVFHNCPALAYAFDGKTQVPVILPGTTGDNAAQDGDSKETKTEQSLDPELQYVTMLEPKTKHLITTPVERHSDKQYPTFMNADKRTSSSGANGSSKDEIIGGANGSSKDQEAQNFKEQGNQAFKTSDFMQAAAFYTLSLKAKPDTVVYANRAQCWLKTGEFQKAVDDAEEAIALSNGENAKAYFRLGMAKHGLATSDDIVKAKNAKEQCGGLFQAALAALGKAEKLDPKNKQIVLSLHSSQSCIRCRRYLLLRQQTRTVVVKNKQRYTR